MLKSTIIKSLNSLSIEDLSQFCETFKNGKYIFKNVDHQAENIDLERTRNCFRDVKTYRNILNDTQAKIQYFSIECEVKKRVLVLPLGVYGVSAQNKFAFPLLLNDFWLDFLSVSKADFATFLKIDHEQSADEYFSRLIDLRKTFLTSVFTFYVSASPKLTSAMAWKIRGVKSLTRSTAEGAGFFRYEIEEYELYSSKKITKARLKFLHECLIRWFYQFKNNCVASSVEEQRNQYVFAKYLVDYQV